MKQQDIKLEGERRFTKLEASIQAEAVYRIRARFTRDSTEMLDIRMKHGLAGYAVAVMLLEKIAESHNREVERNYDAIGFEFRADAAIIKKVIEDNTLFQISANGKITIKGQ